MQNLSPKPQYDSKREAIQDAQALRAQGKIVKVFQHEGIYTAPGVGIRSYRYFTVKVLG